MANLLGLLGFALYVVLIVGFAALITWFVVRLTPPQGKKPNDSAPG